MTGDRDWLICSLKWSQSSDHLVWYRPDGNGYTTNLALAGRYTLGEALSHECPNVTVAVPYKAAMLESQTVVTVPRDANIGDRLRARRDAAVAEGCER